MCENNVTSSIILEKNEGFPLASYVHWHLKPIQFNKAIDGASGMLKAIFALSHPYQLYLFSSINSK